MSEAACPTAAARAQAPEHLLGGKYLKVLDRCLKRLRQAYPHPNRRLHYDELFVAYLLAFYNPVLRSLRSLEDVSRTPLLQEHLSIPRLCRSTVSDANRLLDPALLLPLIRQLRQRLPQLPRSDRTLDKLLGQLVLVDGSLFSVAANVSWALRKRKPGSDRVDDRFVRLDLQLCCLTGVPEEVSIAGRGSSETAAAAARVRAGVIYVADRGIFSYAYLKKIRLAGSEFVLRIKSDRRFLALEQRPLTEADRAAGVISDCVGCLLHGKPARPLPLLLREVLILDPARPQRPLRLLSSLLEETVSAEMLGTLYRCRWQIELFFRWLKVQVHFRHLISHSENGLTLGFYVAVIGTLLLYLHTGRRVSQYAYNLLGVVAVGGASLEDILPILQDREREKDRERARLARQRAAKTKA